VGALILLTIPAILQSEVVYLKDGSEIRGKLVSCAGDTLTFEPSFGGRIHIHRSDVVQIVFDESKAARHVGAETEPVAEGPGVIKITFKDDKLNSKIAVTRKSKNTEAEIIRANWIEQLLIVEGDTVYSRVDSTMDKTINKGHEKLYKNTIELDDMSAELEAGIHACVVVIRNLGTGTFDGDFDEGPLDLTLTFETVGLYPNRTTQLRVGIKKGFMRMGKPKLYLVE
jgi:hypothetical protein